MTKSAARKTRIAAITGVTIGVVSLGIAGTAMATDPAHPGPRTTHTSAQQADSSDTVQTVSKFYNNYITYGGDGDQETADQLRSTHMTSRLNDELDAWSDEHHADPVVRSRDYPVSADVTYDNSGMGHSWTVVTLNWDGGKKTTLHVQSDNESQKISDIKD